MNLPSRTRSAFEGTLDRIIERFGQRVTVIRAPEKGDTWSSERRYFLDAALGFQEADQPIRFEQWGRGNLMNANPSWLLFKPTFLPREGDVVRLISNEYYRITNVNPADMVIGEVQGWICQIVKER